jgi:hypothetical protein
MADSVVHLEHAQAASGEARLDNARAPREKRSQEDAQQGGSMLAFLLLFVTLGRLYRDMIKQPETRALLLLTMAVIITGIAFYLGVEGWSFVNALYFCVVTLGTVGHGDITPTTEIGNLFTVAYIIVGLGVIGGFFATLGKLIDPQRLLAFRVTPPDLSKPIEALSQERERLAGLIRRDEAPATKQDERATAR